MRTSAQLTLVYDGPALKTGEIKVRDLAPALLAVADLFEATGRSLNRDYEVTVAVTELRNGSIGIDFTVVMDVAQHAMNVVGDIDLDTAEKVVSLIVGTGALAEGSRRGLLWLLAKLKGRKPEGVAREDGQVSITVNNGPTTNISVTNNIVVEKIVVSEETFRAACDPEVRRAIREVVEPLKQEGITELTVQAPSLEAAPEPIKITKAEVDDYKDDVLLDQKVTSISHYERVFRVVSPTFVAGNKWRLDDGRKRSLGVRDEDFLENVELRKVKFGAGDTLHCRVEVVQTQDLTTGKLSIDETVVKVLKHEPPPDQIEMFDLPRQAVSGVQLVQTAAKEQRRLEENKAKPKKYGGVAAEERPRTGTQARQVKVKLGRSDESQ